MSDPKLCLIVARARNGVIGAKGDMPWRLRDDLKHFKAVTHAAPIIMGRKTWESLPKRPLPARPNLVVSRDWSYAAPGARVYSSLAAALAGGRSIAVREGREEVFVVGGGVLYEAALPLAERIYLTEVDAAPEGDTYFPEIDMDAWRVISSKAHEADARNDHAFRIVVLEQASSDHASSSLPPT